MITLYRKEECSYCDEIEETLQELVLAHQVIIAETETILPVLKEGKHTYRTQPEINAFLKEIRGEVVLNWEIQSDSCIIDPETGEVCHF